TGRIVEKPAQERGVGKEVVRHEEGDQRRSGASGAFVADAVPGKESGRRDRYQHGIPGDGSHDLRDTVRGAEHWSHERAVAVANHEAAATGGDELLRGESANGVGVQP